MIKRLLVRIRKNERGAALIEFALVLPILVVLLMGILEFGWWLNGWIVITGAAREGARAAVVAQDNPRGEAEKAVNEYTQTFYYQPDVNFFEDDESITVYVNGRLRPLVGFFVRTDIFLEADSTMRREFTVY